MMGIGFGEMVLLAGIALVVIGPEKFPEFAKVVVRTIRDLRGYMDEVKKELADELKPVEREMRSLTRPDTRTYSRPVSTTTSPSRKESPAPSLTPASDVSTPSQSGKTAGQASTPAAASADVSRMEYGTYSPEQDEDYDHSAEHEQEGGTETLSKVTPPDRLDG